MKRYFSSSIGLNDFDRLSFNHILDKYEAKYSRLKQVSVYFTQDDDHVQAIVELELKNNKKRRKLIIKKSTGSTQTKALKKAMKKAAEKVESILMKKRAKAA